MASGESPPPELIGIHTNMPGAVPPDIGRSLRAGEPAPPGLTEEERRAYEQLDFVFKHVGYAVMMATHPQSLTMLADSPIGLAAYMLDFDLRLYALIERVFDGKPEGLTRDDVVDNMTLYWLTNTALSSARLYWENKFSYFDAKGVGVPTAVSVYPDELYRAPRSWAQRAYPKLMHYNELPRGGHFPAWEQPKIFVDELRAGFRSLRKAS
jgi:pimeloyl-ACP methyl ester carboxylesterase